jgi:nucleoside-diphosphate-sugar epimerase
MVVGITGASGFVGSVLVRRHVEAGDVVRCLSRRPSAISQSGVQVIEGDLERPDNALARFADGLDVLYHCAGEVRDVRRMQAVNVEGVRALLRAAARRIGRWVQLSSVGVYGSSQSGLISEDSPVAPRGIYEQTKADADALVMEAGRLRDIASYAVLRPSIVFGPGMPNQSIAQMMRMVQHRLFFYIGRSVGPRRKLTARSTTCPTGAPWKTSSARSLTRSAARSPACGSRSGQSAERFG